MKKILQTIQEKYLENIKVIDSQVRPWGWFLVVDPADIKQFANAFFLDEKIDISLPLQPKLLIVLPNEKLSWQYHHRRSELWVLVEWDSKVVLSETDELWYETDLEVWKPISIKWWTRHRLVGWNELGVVAEIWEHTDKNNLSNEDDIIRLEDKYSRN